MVNVELDNDSSTTKLAKLTPSPLINIIHQTDRNGKQSDVKDVERKQTNQLLFQAPEKSGSKRHIHGHDNGGSFRSLFSNILSALGVPDQPIANGNRKAIKALPASESRSMGRSIENKTRQNVSKNNETRKSIIPPQLDQDAGKKCLVLDLDETLVHSSFKPTQNPDYVIPVEIDGVTHTVYVCKRPGAEAFLVEMAKIYEVAVYTASLGKYANPLLDMLDSHNTIRHRLFREHCVQYEGNFVKDLSLLGRDIKQTIIIDNSPMSYLFHPRNAIGCSSFFDDMNDTELDSIQRFLYNIRNVEDVRVHLHTWDANY